MSYETLVSNFLLNILLLIVNYIFTKDLNLATASDGPVVDKEAGCSPIIRAGFPATTVKGGRTMFGGTTVPFSILT